MNSKRVLWIDDQAHAQLDEYLGPVNVTGKYALEVTSNASEALEKFRINEYDIVIIDVRIECGDNPAIKDWVIRNGVRNRISRLGMQILELLFEEGLTDPIVPKYNKPKWIDPKKFGILTVDGNDVVNKALNVYQIAAYKQKSVVNPRKQLLMIIEEVESVNSEGAKGV